jgi:hypothetical protein
MILDFGTPYVSCTDVDFPVSSQVARTFKEYGSF